MRLPNTVRGPLTSLIVVAVALLLSGLTGVASWKGGSADGDHLEDDGRYAQLLRIYEVNPGDIVEINTPRTNGWEYASGNVKFIVVEGGEGDALLLGQPAEHVLYEADYEPFIMRFTRPDIYSGKPHGEGLNGDTYSAVDILWIYERPEGMSQADYDEGLGAVKSQLFQIHHEVARGWTTHLQTVWTVIAWAGLAAFVVTGVAWLRNKPTAVEPAEGTERMLQIQDHAQRYLLQLRSTLRIAGAFLIVGGWGATESLLEFLQMVEIAPFDGWDMWVANAALLLYVLAIGFWIVQYRRVSTEVKRWLASPNPLEA